MAYEDPALSLVARMDTFLSQMNTLRRISIVGLVISLVLLACAAVVIVLLLRIRRRNHKVELWLVRELSATQGKLDALLHAAQPTAAIQPGRTNAPKRPPAVPQRRTSAGEPRPIAPTTPAAHAQHASDAAPSAAPVDLIATLNEMLAGNQPYNFVESIRAIAPHMTVERLTPQANAELFHGDVILQPGGDGLFAQIQGDNALLYPNYSRFSATLDPKPIFEGAKPGTRIHAILKPASLRRQPDGSWMLVDKGRVEMRQGN